MLPKDVVKFAANYMMFLAMPSTAWNMMTNFVTNTQKNKNVMGCFSVGCSGVLRHGNILQSGKELANLLSQYGQYKED